MNKKTISTSFVMLLLVSILAFSSRIESAKAATITVPDDYPTIQEAINNAADGDTVFVKAGTYYEHVVVNKTVSLLGENSKTTVVDGNWTGVVINVTQSNVFISSLTVQRSGSVYWENAGIFLDNVENCTLKENILTENSFAGLELNHSHRCIVSENNISGNSGVGITVVSGSFNNLSRNSIAENGWSALTLNDETYNNTISENNMTSNNLAGTGHCINLYRSSNNSIQKNNITGDDNGIRLEYWSNHNTIAKNNITSNTLTGVLVETYSDNNTISGNVISGSISGVVISSSRYVEIFSNTIAHNYGGDWDAGIRLDSAGYSIIYSNLITDNWRGILLYTTSPHVSIYNNNITYNEFAVRVASGGSNYLNVTDNIVMNNRGYGVGLTGFGGASNYATISRNLLLNNSDGIALGQYSNYNTILQNNISQNGYGFYIDYSTQNTILGNNIINNDQQVYISTGSTNNWDDDYPSGGNYWSNYTGTDIHRGPQQNLSEGDGLGDTPHVLVAGNRDNYPLMEPRSWAPNDVAVKAVTLSKRVIGRGYSLHVNVTVANQGTFTEDFNVTLHVNATIIHEKPVVLSSGDSTTLSLTWNSSVFEYGYYIVWAYAEPVPGEAFTVDNTYVAAVIIVTIPGDVDGDRDVDISDIVMMADAYYSEQGDPRYFAEGDFNGDGDIDIYDVVIAAANYGQSY